MLFFLNSAIFLFKKTQDFRKMPTEKQIIEQITKGNLALPPLKIRLLKNKSASEDNLFTTSVIEVDWQGKKTKFAVTLKSISTPKAFQAAINHLKLMSPPGDYGLMLIMPFLNDDQLHELESNGLSGIDLCGNGVVIAPDTFAVFRSGGKNLFPSSALIKNVYRKNSSMVSRAFLALPSYNTVQEICEEVNRLNLLISSWNKTPMSISTVSKALKTLENDLIISREDAISLLQPDKLLDKLSEYYSPVVIKKAIRLKLMVEKESMTKTLRETAQQAGLPLVAAGTSSVSQYAVMQRGDVLSLYCPRIEKIAEMLPGSQSDRFPNLELIETEDETVFFDAREQENFRWASPIQVYLELMAGDKRDRETAEQLKTLIIKNVSNRKPE